MANSNLSGVQRPDGLGEFNQSQSDNDDGREHTGSRLVGYTAFGLFAGVIGIAAYKYRTQGVAIKPSLFLINVRVAAQTAVIGFLTLGMMYQIIEQNFLHKEKNKHEHGK